eukprot:1818432-Pleurochrysis_carterae.AAC.1
MTFVYVLRGVKRPMAVICVARSAQFPRHLRLAILTFVFVLRGVKRPMEASCAARFAHFPRHLRLATQ